MTKMSSIVALIIIFAKKTKKKTKDQSIIKEYDYILKSCLSFNHLGFRYDLCFFFVHNLDYM